MKVQRGKMKDERGKMKDFSLLFALCSLLLRLIFTGGLPSPLALLVSGNDVIIYNLFALSSFIFHLCSCVTPLHPLHPLHPCNAVTFNTVEGV